jgi:hypothetical protein
LLRAGNRHTLCLPHKSGQYPIATYGETMKDGKRMQVTPATAVQSIGERNWRKEVIMDIKGRDHFGSGGGNGGSGEPKRGMLDSAEHFVQSVLADTLRDLLKESVDRLPEVVESQLRLARDEARIELKDVGRKAMHVAGPWGVGITFAILAVGFALLAIAHALAMIIPAWAAALIVAIFTAIVALALINVGKQRFRTMHINTDKPIEKVAQNITTGVTRLADTH